MIDPSPSSVFTFLDRAALAKARSGEEVVLPADVLEHHRRAGFSNAELNAIVGLDETAPPDPYEQLTPDQTDRVVRLNHIMALAEVVFGDSEKAFVWLRSPNSSLGRKTPVEVVRRETGARLVEEALLRIEHGLYA